MLQTAAHKSSATDYLDAPKETADRIFAPAFDALSCCDRSDDARLVRAAYFFAEIYCTRGQGEYVRSALESFPNADYSRGNPRLSLNSRLAYLKCFPKALFCIRRRQIRVDGPLGEAIRILSDSGLFEVRVDAKQPQQRRRWSRKRPVVAVRSRKILWPGDIEQLFGLDKPPPRKQEFSQYQMDLLARRVMTIILVRCLQRFRSFVRFALEHIVCGDLNPWLNPVPILLFEELLLESFELGLGCTDHVAGLARTQEFDVFSLIMPRSSTQIRPAWPHLSSMRVTISSMVVTSARWPAKTSWEMGNPSGVTTIPIQTSLQSARQSRL